MSESTDLGTAWVEPPIVDENGAVVWSRTIAATLYWHSEAELEDEIERLVAQWRVSAAALRKSLTSAQTVTEQHRELDGLLVTVWAEIKMRLIELRRRSERWQREVADGR